MQTNGMKSTFLICPIRTATPDEKKGLEGIISDLNGQGYIVRYPQWHTDQTDDGVGYRICWDNRAHIILSDSVHLFLSNNSIGSWLDIGMAFAAWKPLYFINSGEFSDSESDEIKFLLDYDSCHLESERYKRMKGRFEEIKKAKVVAYKWKPGMESDRAFLMDLGMAFMDKGLAERLGREKYIMVENPSDVRVTERKSPQNVLLKLTDEYYARLESLV